MDAIILTGGRGKRLGALTCNQPKATLHFAGKTLLAHALISLADVHRQIERIYVATGYHAAMIESVLQREISTLSINTPVTVLPAERDLGGTFKSTVWALQTACVTGGCLIAGIDVIMAKSAMTDFVTRIQSNTRTTFVVSPLLSIAPTHGHILLKDSARIVEYRKSSAFPASIESGNQWYSDVGIRYFSNSFVQECRSLTLNGPCDFDDVVPHLVKNGNTFNAYVLEGRWLHFGRGQDFRQKPL